MLENKSFALSCWESRVWCIVRKMTFRWKKLSTAPMTMGTRKLPPAALLSVNLRGSGLILSCNGVRTLLTWAASLWTGNSDNWIRTPGSAWSQLTNSTEWEDWDHRLSTTQLKAGKWDVLDERKSDFHLQTESTGLASSWASLLFISPVAAAFYRPGGSWYHHSKLQRCKSYMKRANFCSVPVWPLTPL